MFVSHLILFCKVDQNSFFTVTKVDDFSCSAWLNKDIFEHTFFPKASVSYSCALLVFLWLHRSGS